MSLETEHARYFTAGTERNNANHFVFLLDGSLSMKNVDGFHLFGGKTRWDIMAIHMKSFFENAKKTFGADDVYSIFSFGTQSIKIEECQSIDYFIGK